MLTIVSKEAFDELNRVVSEDFEKKFPFDYNDFKEEVLHYSMVNDYLKNKMIEFVGTGSARTAYMIPKGGCKNVKRRAVCLKVAKNVKGIAQNKGEIKMLEDFNWKRNPCFPELFGIDKHTNISLLCEIGRKVDSKEFDDFFSFWNDFRRNGFHEDARREIPEIGTFDDVFVALKRIKRLKKMGNEGKEPMKRILDDFKRVAKADKKYVPFVSLFEVLFEKEAVYEISIGDFAEKDNWAFVNRDNEDVLVPIDWGLTNEVANQYYM